MRIKTMSNQSRVYLHPNDYQELLDNSTNDTAYWSMRLCGECSLRIGEAANLRRDDIRGTTELETDVRFLIIRGKDTTGTLEEGKLREIPVEESFLSALLEHHIRQVRDGTIDRDDTRILGFSKRTLQKYIKETAVATAETTGIEEYELVSAHDFRAYFATNNLIRKKKNPQIVIEVGGWVDYKSIQPYLNAAFDDIIVSEFYPAAVAGQNTQGAVA